MSDNLTNLISAAVAAKMTPDFIEKEVNSRVEKLVIECIDRSFRSYSDTAKQVEEAVTAALKVDRLDLPSYGAMVTAMLKSQIEAVVSPIVAGRLAADMEELLKLAPAEIKLSEIADGMRERYRDRHDHAYGPIISVVVEESETIPGYYRIGLDEDEADRRTLRACDYEIAIGKDGKIYSATLEGRNLKDTSRLGRNWGMDQLIRGWYACGTKIIVDEDAVVTSEGDY
ncbi:MAG: hypothetical protein H2050_15640 [Sphingobium sp.]|uniref:hypothetical protein n=1 Tax=Sphingobium sp. TaxID=1912891 RepID=UPI00185D0799|nr:hypothetical protein [Sphingobium sp.]MBA4756258.1 hypothetical protein [Sphingobium sp.]